MDLNSSIPNTDDSNLIPEREVKIPNLLIAGKYRATLSENRALAMSIANAYYDEEQKRHVAVLNKEDLEKIMVNTHARRKQALAIATHLNGRDIIVENEENDTFTVMNFIGVCKYESGSLMVYFEPQASAILAAEKDKTRMHLDTILSFKSSYTYRLYEYLLLKTNQLVVAGQTTGPYDIEVELNRLKLTIGLVEITKSVKDDLLNGIAPEEVVEKAAIQLFRNWSDFRRYALEVSIKEINQGTSLEVTYDTKNVKGSRAVGSIIFHVSVNSELRSNDVIKQESPAKQTEIPVSENISVVPKSTASSILPSRDVIIAADATIQEMIVGLTPAERVKLLQAAHYDIDILREVYTRSIIELVEQEKTFEWMMTVLTKEYV